MYYLGYMSGYLIERLKMNQDYDIYHVGRECRETLLGIFDKVKKHHNAKTLTLSQRELDLIEEFEQKRKTPKYD